MKIWLQKTLIVGVLCTPVLAAQSLRLDYYKDVFGENAGHTTCAFLTLPLSAGVLGGGGVASQGMKDATDLPDFSANSGLSEKNLFAVTHLEWFMDLRKEYAGAAFPLFDIGTFGLFSQMFTIGSDPFARTIDEKSSELSMMEYSIGASFARSFLDRKLSAGCAVSYVESHLDDCIGRATAGSGDLFFLPADRITSRIYFRNIGTDVHYTSGSEPLPAQIGAVACYFPMQSIDPELGFFNKLSVSTGIQKTADEPLGLGIGTEWKPNRFFSIRSGYEYLLGSEISSIVGLGAGIGFKADRLGVDGAWKYQSPEFGSIWAASVKMEVDELRTHSSKDYLKLAQKSFEREQYKLCIHFAKKVLRSDPNEWKAHVLLSKAQSELLRRKKLEISLIYTGNIQGQFLPPYLPEAVGGLARQATVINGIRQQFPVSFSAAAGNMVTGRSHPLKARVAQKYYRYINNDAVALGNGEFDFGVEKFLKADSSHVPLLCLAGPELGDKNVVTRKIVEHDRYKIAFISFVNNPELRRLVEKRAPSPAEELRMELRRGDVLKCDLRVVMVHDGWNMIKANLPALEGADVVICGGIDQRFETPMKLGPAIAVSAGSNGMFVGNLTLRFDGNRKLASYDNRLYPLSGDIAPDSTVDRMLSAISAEINSNEKNLSEIDLKKASTMGVFPFLSSRSGTRGVYLKMIDKYAEYPLVTEDDVAGALACSFEAGKVSYSRRDTARGYLPLKVLDLQGTNMSTLMDSINAREALFSPDGKWLYVAAASAGDTLSDIFRIRPDGGPAFPVVAWKNSTECGMTFAPDFSEMVFSSNRDGSWQLYFTNPDGEHPLRLTDVSGNCKTPHYSPDGSFIAYLSDETNAHGGIDLWVYDRKGNTHTQLTEDTYVNSYCWLDDSKTLVFSSGLDFPELNVVGVEHDVPAKLIRPSSQPSALQYGEYDPLFLEYKARKKIVYVRKFDTGESHVFWVSADGTDDQCLIRSNGSDWLK